jgi:hypothetical protein
VLEAVPRDLVAARHHAPNGGGMCDARLADHEEGGARVEPVEHVEVGVGQLVGTVVEGEGDLLAARLRPLGATPHDDRPRHGLGERPYARAGETNPGGEAAPSSFGGPSGGAILVPVSPPVRWVSGTPPAPASRRGGQRSLPSRRATRAAPPRRNRRVCRGPPRGPGPAPWGPPRARARPARTGGRRRGCRPRASPRHGARRRGPRAARWASPRGGWAA